jgi:undecaprenyl-diphosphatase
MAAGLLGVCVATVLSVWCQVHLNVHTRPLIDTALQLKGIDDLRWTRWDRASSFPSDTGTLFFGLVAVVFLENRLVGLLCLVWVAVVVAIPRIAFGLHYPSDMIGSLIWGPACVLFFSKLPYARALLERALFVLKGRMYLVHALLFVFLAETSNVFQSLQAIGMNFVKMLH